MNEEGGKGKKGKSGGSSFDIMTVAGVIVAMVLIVFGIVYEVPPKQSDYMNDDGSENTAAYQEALDEYTKLGTFRFSTVTNAFIDYPSVAIVVGGTVGALMVAFPMSTVMNIGSYIKIAILPNKYDPEEYISQIVDFAKEARVKGLLSLEDKLSQAKDPFLKSSLMLVVDSVEPEKVHNLLQAELEKMDDRHAIGKSFMDMGGAFAPGFGMIGTLIGLIKMLGQMDDPNSIGPAMAVALLTTMYGSMMANIIFSPLANKLGLRHNEEYLCKELICEGVEAIQAGENPKFIEEKLNLLVIQKKKKGKKGKGEDEG